MNHIKRLFIISGIFAMIVATMDCDLDKKTTSNETRSITKPIIKFKFNKLCRDNCLKNGLEQGIKSHYKLLNKAELAICLNDKLIEEAHELIEAKSNKEIIEEIADVLQVIDSIAELHNISIDEIQAVKNNKFKQQGGYNQGIYIYEICMDNDNPRAQHFRASPNKYIEIN